MTPVDDLRRAASHVIQAWHVDPGSPPNGALHQAVTELDAALAAAESQREALDPYNLTAHMNPVERRQTALALREQMQKQADSLRAALKEQSKENTMTIAEPQPVEIHDGISYRVELRVTPNRDLNGLPSQGNQMWSADLITADDDPGIVAHGATAEEALLAIGRVVFDKSAPLEPSDG